jgi:hypothetical protein
MEGSPIIFIAKKAKGPKERKVVIQFFVPSGLYSSTFIS